MVNRKPFRLTWAIIPYNLSMALLNGYIAVQVLTELQAEIHRHSLNYILSAPNRLL